MKIKFLLILSLFLAAMSCSKDEEPLPADWNPEDFLGSNWWQTDYSPQKTTTPKGLVYYKFVNKTDLPEWLLSKTESITYGYIMKAGSGDDILYFVYDEGKEYGLHYDALGYPTEDNPKLKDWIIIYKWDPNLGMSTPKGWYHYRLLNKANLPEWLLSKTESIARGYIMSAFSSDVHLYFIYDEDKENGQHYDAQGNPAKDNDKLKNWTIIYRWDPASGMLTPNGWGCYKLVNKEDLPAWLLSKTESIANGYIMKASSGDDILYFVCVKDNTDGNYYDAQGNPTTDNYKLRNWAIIYTWETHTDGIN